MIRTVLGDITKVDYVDAIVNAANTSLLGGGGVDGAIHAAAGPELLEACKQLNGCETGKAKITPGFQLPCKYVIHAVGPIWHGGTRDERALLFSAYFQSLHVAKDNGLKKIAFPSISTGIYNFPLYLAAEVAIKAVTVFQQDFPGTVTDVYFLFIDPHVKNAYEAELKKQTKKNVNDLFDKYDSMEADAYIDKTIELEKEILSEIDQSKTDALEKELMEELSNVEESQDDDSNQNSGES